VNWTVKTNMGSDLRTIFSGPQDEAQEMFPMVCDKVLRDAIVTLENDMGMTVDKATPPAMMAKRKIGKKMTLSKAERHRRAKRMRAAQSARWKKTAGDDR